jgi:hypothetical protein
MCRPIPLSFTIPPSRTPTYDDRFLDAKLFGL